MKYLWCVKFSWQALVSGPNDSNQNVFSGSMDSRSDAPTFCGLAVFLGGEVSCSMKDNTVCVANSSSLTYYENNDQASVSKKKKKTVEMSTVAGLRHTILLSSSAWGVPIVFYGSHPRLNRILASTFQDEWVNRKQILNLLKIQSYGVQKE